MAEYADRVVTELIADTSGHDPKLLTSARVTEQAMTQIERSATRAEGAVRSSSQGIVRSMGQMSTQSRLLGYQISDIGVQLAGGQSPFLILAQQAPQVANALEGTTGVAGRMATFFSGPWGAALLAAGSVIGIILGKLVDFKSELEEATDKLEENARKAEINRQAQASFALTLSGVTESIRATQEALNQLAHAHDSAAQRALVSALTQQNLLQAYLAQTDAIIQQTHAQIELNRARNQVAGNDPRITAPLNAENDASVERLQQIEQALITARARIIETAGQVREAISQVSVEQGSKSPEDRIHDHYNGLVEAARLRAKAERGVGDELARQVRLYRDQERAEVEALQRAERQARRTPAAVRDLTRPTAGALLSPYGADRSGVPLNGRRVAGRRHEGVDLRGDLGDPVVAPEGGTATVRSAPGGLGLYVEIRADSGARDLLGHLSRAFGAVGSSQRVDAGDLLGAIGNSGNAAGGPTHLHWQRQVNGQWVDPMRSVGASGAAGAAQAATNAAERAAREAAQVAERRQRDEDQFQQQLAGLNADIVNARRRQVQSEEDAAEADIAAIRAEQAERDTRIRNEADARIRRDGTQIGIANVEAGLLLAASQELADTKEAQRGALEHQRLDEQRIEIAQRDLNDQESVLRARGQLARTAIERRDIELRLLDLAHQEELLAIQKQRTQQNLSPAQREQLDRQEAAANTRYGLDKQNVLRQTAGPLEAYLNAIPKGAAEMNEALQEVAAHGLASLNDGLAQAATNFLHLGGVAGNILNQILSDLIRIALQQAEMAAFGGGKGGGGLFSVIGQALGIASTATGGGGAGFDYGALIKGAVNLSGHANGYVGPIGGVGGRDNNVLSINGQPRAMVSGSETLAIIPQGASLGYTGGSAAGRGSSAAGAAKVIVELHGDIDGRIATVSGPVAVEVVRRAAPQIIEGAKAETFRSISRPRLNR